MKRYRFLIVICLVPAMLAGCGRQAENPYRVDTVVQIPVDPTEPPTEPGAEEETEAASEPEATAEETKSTSAARSSSGSKSSSGSRSSSSGKNSSGTKATEPPVTEAPTEAPTELPYDPSGYSVGSLEYAVLDAVNACRAEAGVPALSMSTKLCGIAALRSEEVMQIWSHSRPDGRDFTSALSDYGYGYGAAAENLAHATDSDSQAIVDKWMSADSNRSSLLSAGFSTAGIGVYRSGGVAYVCCLLVG